MIPFNLVACLGNVISNGRRMAVTRQRLGMFRFPVMYTVSSSLLIVHSGFKLVPRRRGSQKAHGVKMAAMFRGRPCLCEVFLTVL